MAFWLFKTEPDVYSIDTLKAEKNGTGVWDGIRNYQARNLLRDAVSAGDEVFIYHSSCKLIGIAGSATVVRAAYPDPAQYNPESSYFDPKASPDTPRWFCVDLCFKEKFATLISLKDIKANPKLSEMTLLKQGRLSIQPVTPSEWQTLQKMK